MIEIGPYVICFALGIFFGVRMNQAAEEMEDE